MPNKFYTGVGSRNTPTEILTLMTAIAHKLYAMNYILRSGGAAGADTAFELGASQKKQIFTANMTTKEAMDIASKYHPAWNKCSTFARKLHGRNAFQVLGPNLCKPSALLICWTPDGCISHAERTINTGGTGTAISIANAYNVSIYNLQRANHLDIWTKWTHSI
jgi:hypothetical protein